MRINVGVFVNYKRPATKKALKDAIHNDPSTVNFVSTSLVGETFDGYVTDLKPGVSLDVVGPDPYNNRKWYAVVSRTADGKVKVS